MCKYIPDQLSQNISTMVQTQQGTSIISMNGVIKIIL